MTLCNATDDVKKKMRRIQTDIFFGERS